MEKIKKAYDYIFLVFYRFWNSAPIRWWSGWKAGITMVFFWILLISTISNLSGYFFNTILISDYPIIALIFAGIVTFIHYMIYEFNDNWREKVNQFKNLDKKKDSYGIIFVLLLVSVIVFGYMYSIYLIGK